MKKFESINRAFNEVFQAGKLSIGIVVPIENYAQSSVPTMEAHLQRVELIERLGFKALWLRDVPLHVPSFGDAGQTFDPFAYLGYLAAKTKDIALGVSSIALPLHQPVHVAKSAATIDQLSRGRLILGVASGDRYEEYPAMGIDYENRGSLFREAFSYIRNAQAPFPSYTSENYGELNGRVDVLPKAFGKKIPMLITGHSRQSLAWNAEHGDGWIYYPRNLHMQQQTIKDWRDLVQVKGVFGKPFMQPLYVDLQDNADFVPQPIHLGLMTGINPLREFFHHLQAIGVNHVALNLRFNSNKIEHSLEALAEGLLPEFHG